MTLERIVESIPATESYGQGVMRRFESYGFWGGLALGLVVGVLISGPQWHEWSLETSLWVMSGSTLIGAMIGFFAGPIGTASLAKGPAAGFDDTGDGGGPAAGSDGTSAAGGDGGGGGGD